MVACAAIFPTLLDAAMLHTFMCSVTYHSGSCTLTSGISVMGFVCGSASVFVVCFFVFFTLDPSLNKLDSVH